MISSFTCICFFGSGATDFEMLLTSLWTSVKIWFRLSTFSFFTVLICDTAIMLEQMQQTPRTIHNTCTKTKPNKPKKNKTGSKRWKRSYMFECCCDGFHFGLVLQVLVCHLKDVLLFFPLLFILCHFTCGKNGNQHGCICGNYLLSLSCSSSSDSLCLSGSLCADHTLTDS